MKNWLKIHQVLLAALLFAVLAHDDARQLVLAKQPCDRRV